MASTQWEVFTHIRTVLERLLYDRRYFWYLAGLLVLGDTFLTQAIVRYIPCKCSLHSTRFRASICSILSHRDRLRNLHGADRCLRYRCAGLYQYRRAYRTARVRQKRSLPRFRAHSFRSYPAGHVWIHKLLSAFTVSENGVINLKLAQQIYAALYLVTILLTCSVYHAAESLPNYVVIPLVLSKRLHSIFVLRLFNDCWAVGIMTVAILAFQKRWYVTGSALLRYVQSTFTPLLQSVE